MVYLHTTFESAKRNVLTELAAHMIDEPFFHQLRTKEQLGAQHWPFFTLKHAVLIVLAYFNLPGYIVDSSVKCLNGVRGICLVVQGTKSPPELEERVEVFLKDFGVSFGWFAS